MSAPRPHGSGLRAQLGALLLGAAWLAAACDPSGDGDVADDASFGVKLSYRRDAGMDSGVALDADVEGGPTVRVSFLHGFPNIAALVVCHDPDGRDGPAAPQPLGDGTRVLQADFGRASPALELPELTTGTLTLHREAPRDAGAADGGADERDAGAANPCREDAIEATIPLPIPREWYARLDMEARGAGIELGFAEALIGGRTLTLLGSGLALSTGAMANDSDGGLASAFGARALLQSVPPAKPSTFALSLFHAIPNLLGSDAGVASESAPVRVCIEEGTTVRPVVPPAPRPGIAFRTRTPLGTDFEVGKQYTFRVFVQADFDREGKDCASTGLRPLFMPQPFAASRFQAGRSYTLALIGAVAPAELCSPGRTGYARPGCPRPANELAPRLELIEP